MRVVIVCEVSEQVFLESVKSAAERALEHEKNIGTYSGQLARVLVSTGLHHEVLRESWLSPANSHELFKTFHVQWE